MPDDKIYSMTVKEAAEILAVTPGRIHQIIRDGQLPAERPGRDYFLNKEDVEAFKNTIRRRGRPSREEQLAEDTALLQTFIANKISWLDTHPKEITKLKRALGKDFKDDSQITGIILEGLPPILSKHDKRSLYYNHEGSPLKQAIHATLTLYSSYQYKPTSLTSFPGAINDFLVRRLAKEDYALFALYWVKILDSSTYLEFETNAKDLFNEFRLYKVGIRWPELASDLFLFFHDEYTAETAWRWHTSIFWNRV